MDTQKPLICHECYGKLTNYSGHCGHALEVFDSGRTSALNEVDKLSNQLSICRDELSALQKRISEAPKQKVFYDDDGNIVFVESIMGEPLRLDSYDVFTVALVRIEGEKA